MRNGNGKMETQPLKLAGVQNRTDDYVEIYKVTKDNISERHDQQKSQFHC